MYVYKIFSSGKREVKKIFVSTLATTVIEHLYYSFHITFISCFPAFGVCVRVSTCLRLLSHILPHM